MASVQASSITLLGYEPIGLQRLSNETNTHAKKQNAFQEQPTRVEQFSNEQWNMRYGDWDNPLGTTSLL